MNEDWVVFIPILIFALVSLIGKFLKPKPTQEEPKQDRPKQTQKPIENRLPIQTPPLVTPPSEQEKTKRRSLMEDHFAFQSDIEDRALRSKVSKRHVESSLENFGYKSLLQERFSDQVFEKVKRPSKVLSLLKGQKNLKDVIILSEILNKKF